MACTGLMTYTDTLACRTHFFPSTLNSRFCIFLFLSSALIFLYKWVISWIYLPSCSVCHFLFNSLYANPKASLASLINALSCSIWLSGHFFESFLLDSSSLSILFNMSSYDSCLVPYLSNLSLVFLFIWIVVTSSNICVNSITYLYS